MQHMLRKQRIVKTNSNSEIKMKKHPHHIWEVRMQCFLEIFLVECLHPVEGDAVEVVVEIGMAGTGDNHQFFVVA